MKLKLFFCITILALFASSTTLACYCSILSTITSNYQQANFVGLVKILKNYKNYPDTNEHYKADVEVLNLYKGKSVKACIYLVTMEEKHIILAEHLYKRAKLGWFLVVSQKTN